MTDSIKRSIQSSGDSISLGPNNPAHTPTHMPHPLTQGEIFDNPAFKQAMNSKQQEVVAEEMRKCREAQTQSAGDSAPPLNVQLMQEIDVLKKRVTALDAKVWQLTATPKPQASSPQPTPPPSPTPGSSHKPESQPNFPDWSSSQMQLLVSLEQLLDGYAAKHNTITRVNPLYWCVYQAVQLAKRIS